MSEGAVLERWPVVYLFFPSFPLFFLRGEANSFALVTREVHAFLICSLVQFSVMLRGSFTVVIPCWSGWHESISVCHACH